MFAASSAVTVKLNAVAPVAAAGATTEKWVAAPGVMLNAELMAAVSAPEVAVRV